MVDHQCDVVVIGAGIIGASAAYHLAKHGLNVTVVESFPGPAQGSTGLSFSSIRGQWAWGGHLSCICNLIRFGSTPTSVGRTIEPSRRSLAM